ncbi:hypothetical protein [Agromyces archimandritae]|uniref:Uncharacterized protein n=1 Tax=Agromyces archimandritae TaxID=2781962 RepID=A0A975INK2_9MICO|nr:hypothetical protein [Agromyces archimandritae]QTX04324.1 hypothetical protein G127AT_13750 [Agromyces archimandritae]
MSEIIAMSVLGGLIVFVLCAFPGNDSVAAGMDMAPQFGMVVLEHIGWGFGVYVPILLSFYAIVIGGQLVADSTTAASTRRMFGFAAEAMAGALVPALVLIVAACVADPMQVGSLFVIVPVSAVVFFLAIQLGGFIVFERSLRLSAAERARDWAKEHLGALKPRSRKPIWFVVVAHAVVGGAGGLGITLLLDRPSGSLLMLFLLYGSVALGLGLASVNGLFTYRTTQDRLYTVTAWIICSTLYLVGLLLALEAFVRIGPAAGLGVLSSVVLSLISTFWPRHRASRFVLDWSLHGAATRYAARSITTRYVRNVRVIRELVQSPEPDQPISLQDRIMVVFRPVRGDTSAPHGDSCTCRRTFDRSHGHCDAHTFESEDINSGSAV